MHFSSTISTYNFIHLHFYFRVKIIFFNFSRSAYGRYDPPATPHLHTNSADLLRSGRAAYNRWYRGNLLAGLNTYSPRFYVDTRPATKPLKYVHLGYRHLLKNEPAYLSRTRYY